jgi:hypothetical protein
MFQNSRAEMLRHNKQRFEITISGIGQTILER